MRVLSVLAAALLSAGAMAGGIKGSGNVIEQTRTVADFQSIRSEGAWSLDVKVGPAPSLKIRADDNLIPLIETSVSNNQLFIRMKELPDKTIHIGDKSSLRIELTVPKLTGYTHEGAGKAAFHDLSGDKFTLAYEGAGLVTATGKVDKLTVQASGAGAVDFDKLKARDVTVNLEGVGAVSVYASDSLTASVEGIGSLTYYGKPGKLSKSVSGIGSVRAGD
ncbi:head GIN domain-containing protein [Chitinimonas sp.]|uniref:head GIN domain-containing protein n=1 Tax=Chitinimonas sp. TaxID=1934313 RepID=UPI002F93A7FA